MKKLILLLFIPLVSFGQIEEKITYYENGAVKSKKNYVDGELHGESFNYYKSGAVQYKVNYVDGKKQGEEIIYYESGVVDQKGNYVDDKLQGELILYNPNGAIFFKVNYVDGLRQGDRIEYYGVFTRRLSLKKLLKRQILGTSGSGKVKNKAIKAYIPGGASKLSSISLESWYLFKYTSFPYMSYNVTCTSVCCFAKSMVIFPSVGLG